MSKMYHESDANPELLKGKKIAVLGYGSQGKAQSLNLRDSGFDVVIGAREGGGSWNEAKEDGWEPVGFSEAAAQSDVVMLLVPDMAQKALYEEHVAANLKDGDMLMFSHGLNVHYEMIKPPANVDVSLVAPKSPGHLVRTEYADKGAGVPGLIAIYQDATGNAEQVALAYAHGVGCTRAGVQVTTFKEETVTDLFGEQVVLCGGAVELVKAGWETLVEGGYQEELAYFECLHELKLIVDLLYEGGISRMQYFVSDTANYGGLVTGPRIITPEVKARMKDMLTEIEDGTFTRNWCAEHDAGGKNFKAMLKANEDHGIEKVGESVRSHMSWLKK